ASIERKVQLKDLGFGEQQRRVPTLLLPLHSVAGEIAGYQHRPDHPRVHDGRVLKYELPGGSRSVLDVHPEARAWLADPQRPIIITEGIRKGDSAVSQGLACIALLGVWNWRGANDFGGAP